MLRSSFFSTLRQASFRGVPFEVDDADEFGGRRLARHEYPLRDLPFAEDLGRKAGEWRIRAFIVQGRSYDYVQARDALRKALTAYGPATLIHPWLGELTVAVDRFSLRETTSKGGYCEFDIDFVEAGQRENPGARVDTAQAVAASAKECRRALRQSFAALYAPLTKELETCLSALNDGMAWAMEYLQLPEALISDALDFADGLLGVPSGLFDALSGIFGGLTVREDAAAAHDRIGSRLWLLGREKQLAEVVRRAKDYAEEALAWLIDDGVARRVSVTPSVPRQGWLWLEIRIDLADGGEYRQGLEYPL